MNTDSNASDVRKKQMSRRKGVSAGSSGTLESIPESNCKGKSHPGDTERREASEVPEPSGECPGTLENSSDGVTKSVSPGARSTTDSHGHEDVFVGNRNTTGISHKAIARRHTLALFR